MSIEKVLKSFGISWLKTVRSYSIARMVKALRKAMTTPERGLKVIIADVECQLARQRRVRTQVAERIAQGRRDIRTRFGVDEDLCTGDHSCIRLSGCPSLTIRDNPDPLRSDPVSYVDNSCVGCGVCGTNAHSAVLCPSFSRIDLTHNPSAWDRWVNAARGRVREWWRARDRKQRLQRQF